ncbi:MAG: hypothetical protein HYY34_01840 [Chloroflexi bacterium]|nr:hypothetical protein [Chloroflexota bacterium]
MALTTTEIFVRLQTFDPARGAMVPVPRAELTCMNAVSGFDETLSQGTPVTDNDGNARVTIEYEQSEVNSLNPYFLVTVPSAHRAVPAGAAAALQLTVPESWETQHDEERRLPRITESTNPNRPLEIFIGVDSSLRLAYTDFYAATPLAAGKRNPMALPEDTLQVRLIDHDWFIFDWWIFDFIDPDNVMQGFGFDRKAGRTIAVGQDEKPYPYFDRSPTVPYARDLPQPVPLRAWIDPPGAPVGVLGGGSFQAVGPLAVDHHGFVFMIDGAVVRRFYPDRTLCETIPDPATGATFTAPAGLAVDEYRNLFVSDGNRILIHRLESEDGPLFGAGFRRGRYRQTGSIGTAAPGATPGLFNNPRGLAVVPVRAAGHPELLAVADTGNHRIQVFQIAVFSGPFPGVFLTPLTQFGVAGSGPAQFQEPVGVAADRQRRLFICDRANHRVSRWGPDAVPATTAYAHQVDWGKAGAASGAGNGEFSTPEAVAVDRKHGFVYVTESGNRRVQRLDTQTGNHLMHWNAPYAPPLANPFSPSAVAVDERGEVYAADPANQRVIRATAYAPNGSPQPDGTVPTVVGTPWTPLTDAAHMRGPAYVAFASDGRLWVADTGNDRVLGFQRDPSGGLVPAGSPLSGGLSGPTGVAVDAGGHLFVVDTGNNRVRHYDASLAHQGDLAPAAPNALSNPRGIAITQSGESLLYVTDLGNNRVQVLRPDGGFVRTLTRAGANPFAPEDVAVDSRGNVFAGDTANRRVVQFDSAGAFVREFQVPVPDGVAGAFVTPGGVSIDPQDKLLVTDRSANAIYSLEPNGSLLGFWNLDNLARATPAGIYYEPEHARLVRFDAPGRAVADGTGLMAVADTGHDRVRLVRTHLDLGVNLTDLGDELPAVTFSAQATADWRESLGLELVVGGDESRDFITEPEKDFARDHYEFRHVFEETRSTNAAINVMNVMRKAQLWLAYLTRTEDPEHRWGAPGLDTARELTANLQRKRGSCRPWDDDEFYLGGDTAGRGIDAWDDVVAVHEMTHWLFEKVNRPRIPFSREGGTHLLDQIGHQNLAINEGFANFFGLFWGLEFGSTDRTRGFSLAGGAPLRSLRTYNTAVDPPVPTGSFYLFGGPDAAAAPTWNAPGQGMANESHIANVLWQIHHALCEPAILFADSPAFWHAFNGVLTDDQARRFADMFWKALRLFPEDPTAEQFQRGAEQYLKQVLGQARAAHAGFAQTVQSVMELNNTLMPVITVTEGTSTSAPGTAFGGIMTMAEGTTRNFVVQVTDATGTPLPGYNIAVRTANPGRCAFTPPGAGPAVLHGFVDTATPLNRATNASGIVNLSYTAPPGSSGPTPDTLTVEYRPDFDSDQTFSPPEKGDDLETTVRRLYLYQLRASNKTWAGTGNNHGAAVPSFVVVNIHAP